MIVTNELLGYERLKIFQDTDMFHFSLDSMLLAHFVSLNKKIERVVDLCSGNYPIPLYLTLRTKAQIYGIEIQEEAYDLGLKSVKINDLEKEITLINDDVLNALNHFEAHSVDVVTCNPPYFKLNESSNVNPDYRLMVARHEKLIDLEGVIRIASSLLKDGGYFAMVHRPSRLKEIFILLEKYHLNPSRLQFVYPKKDNEANHILIEARLSKGKNDNLKILKPLFVYEDDKWTKDILDVYNYGREKE